jgi:predicted DNA binding protein
MNKPRLPLSIPLLLFLPLAVYAQLAAPNWFSAPESVYPIGEYIAVTGSGSSEVEAQKQAMIEMSRYFHTTVKAVSEEIGKYFETDRSGVTEYSDSTWFNTSSSVRVEEELLGLRFTPAWFNTNAKEYTVLAYVNRKEAETMYRAKIELGMAALDAAAAGVADTGDTLYRYRVYEKCISEADRITRFIENLAVISPEHFNENRGVFNVYLETLQMIHSEFRRLSQQSAKPVIICTEPSLTEQERRTLVQALETAVAGAGIPAFKNTVFVIDLALDKQTQTATGYKLLCAEIQLLFTENGVTVRQSAVKYITDLDRRRLIRLAAQFIGGSMEFYQDVNAYCLQNK